MTRSPCSMSFDTAFWQRLLRFAGYPVGKIDGIPGEQTREAAHQWERDAERHRQAVGHFDERSERNISTLIPEAQQASRLWLKQAKILAHASGMDVKIICGTRSYAEQHELFLKRPRVTRADAGQSFHNFGLAWDFGIFSANGTKYHGDHALYETLGKLATRVPRTIWGGDWPRFRDPAHLQLALYPDAKTARNVFEA